MGDTHPVWVTHQSRVIVHHPEWETPTLFRCCTDPGWGVFALNGTQLYPVWEFANQGLVPITLNGKNTTLFGHLPIQGRDVFTLNGSRPPCLGIRQSRVGSVCPELDTTIPCLGIRQSRVGAYHPEWEEYHHPVWAFANPPCLGIRQSRVISRYYP